MRFVQGLLAVIVVVLLASVSVAQKPPTPEQRSEAARLTADATKAYNLANYAKAIELYKAAYDQVPDPTLLFNIAQSYRLSGDYKLARTFYKNYLNNAPNAANRAQVQQKIAQMEELIAKQEQAATSPPTGPLENDDDERTDIPSPDKVAAGSDDMPPAPTVPEEDRSSKPIFKKWWFWAGIGAVAIGTVAIVAVASSGSDASPPGSDFGNTDIFLSWSGR